VNTDDIDRLILQAESRLKKIESERSEVLFKLEELRHTKEAACKIKESSSSYPIASVTKDSSSAEKIALFRYLFKGREDVYAIRWESRKSGKSGFQPACRNEWIKGLCRKREIRCGECPAREFLPITDAVIRKHLQGINPETLSKRAVHRDFVVGIYPLLLDETCWFLAADFDQKSWKEDIAVFRDSCQRFNIPAVIERSRSGDGAHAWIFFSETIPAATARKLGSILIAEALDQRPEIGLDSYDRLFPSQDTLPERGFGSLIALPLQHRSREMGNTLFLDPAFSPYPDQWAFLSSVRRLSKKEIENVIEEARHRGGIIGVRIPIAEESDDEPWKMFPSRKRDKSLTCGHLPKSISIVLSDLIYVEKEKLPPILRARIIQLCAFQNPEFYKAQAMRLSTYGKPRIISCAEDFEKYIGLPRGCFEEVTDLLNSLGISVDIRDERNSGMPISVQFKGNLRSEQELAAKTMSMHNTGVLAAATAFGKTVVAARLIADRSVNTLVLVHRRQLLDQWTAQLAEFLDLVPDQIGQIGSGKRRPTKFIDIALLQSLNRKGTVDDLPGDYGHLIVDECHHIPASSLERIARRSKAKYILGLSATVTRKDGHHPIIFMQCGPVRYRVTAKQGARMHPFEHRVIFRETNFRMPLSLKDKKPPIHKVYSALVSDKARNMLIFEDVMKSIAVEKRSPILITERKDHLRKFDEKFRSLIKNVIVFHGGMGQKQRNALYEKMRSIPDGEERLLIATGKYLGEGFDDARLDTLFLTMPISWKGTLAQYAGRLHRIHYNKREVRIYDYVDSHVPMLARMHKRRMKGYKTLGYEVGELR
jgi:superfamily II DNA or RNA helicase